MHKAPIITLPGWFDSFPSISIERLGNINRATSGAKHVVLALAYGLMDGHIAKLNRVITGLLLARMRAERSSDSVRITRINHIMEIIHEEIDRVTGYRARAVSGTVCNGSISPDNQL